MKTKIMIMLVVVATTTISCKKNFGCKCSIVRTTSSGTTLTDDGSYEYNATKTSASNKCNEQEHAGTDANGDYYRQCLLE